MEYVILIIVIAVLAVGDRRLAAVRPPPPGPDPRSAEAQDAARGAGHDDPGRERGRRVVRRAGNAGGRDRRARGRAAAAVGGPHGPAARPAGQVAELAGLGAAEPVVQGPPRRRHLGRDRRGADHGRRGRGARPADGRRAEDQGQGARHAEPGRGTRPAQGRTPHPARRGHRPVTAYHTAQRRARGHPDGRGERHRQDHHLREARPGADRGRGDRAARRGRHVPRGSRRPAADVGAAGRRQDGAGRPGGRRPGQRRVRGGQRGHRDRASTW